MKHVTVKGKSYPFRLTIGAMVAYKKAVGEDFSKFNGEDMEKMLHIIFHGIKSACKADGIEFPYQSPEEIADYIDMERITDLFDAKGVDEDDGSKKK